MLPLFWPLKTSPGPATNDLCRLVLVSQLLPRPVRPCEGLTVWTTWTIISGHITKHFLLYMTFPPTPLSFEKISNLIQRTWICPSFWIKRFFMLVLRTATIIQHYHTLIISLLLNTHVKICIENVYKPLN